MPTKGSARGDYRLFTSTCFDKDARLFLEIYEKQWWPLGEEARGPLKKATWPDFLLGRDSGRGRKGGGGGTIVARDPSFLPSIKSGDKVRDALHFTAEFMVPGRENHRLVIESTKEGGGGGGDRPLILSAERPAAPNFSRLFDVSRHRERREEEGYAFGRSRRIKIEETRGRIARERLEFS